MLEVMKSLPVDMVYMVLPHQDGRGYSLRELGILTADIADEIAPLESKDIIPDVPPAPQVTPTVAPQVETQPTVSNSEQVAKKKPRKKSSSDPLPTVVSKGGEVVVTSIVPGTPEQIAAASHFKGF
jgi:hypothetical protein